MAILIVEDDVTQNNVLAGFLQKEGFTTSQAYTIAQANELFTPEIQLVVLDLNLPDGTGLDFLQELRKHSNVLVIVLTALDDELTQLNVFDLKADEYVDKPVSPLIMTRRIQALMNRIYPQNDVVAIHGFLIDFSKYTVTTEDETLIPLTSTEFNIIKVLYENKTITLTREAIIESVWGWEYKNDIRILDPHIKNIRKKLCPEMIVTMKGIGYRFGA
ncbi:MAG: response regulator transcription factor [Turicibacter sp.]|nr:response regulator transcription factor [Turicibacter sp.]